MKLLLLTLLLKHELLLQVCSLITATVPKLIGYSLGLVTAGLGTHEPRVMPFSVI